MTLSADTVSTSLIISKVPVSVLYIDHCRKECFLHSSHGESGLDPEKAQPLFEVWTFISPHNDEAASRL